MATLKVNDVIYNGDGTKTIIINDSTTLESISVSTLNEWADINEDGPVLRKIMASYWKARSGDFSSSTPVVGKLFQLDMGLELGWLQVGSI